MTIARRRVIRHKIGTATWIAATAYLTASWIAFARRGHTNRETTP